jgi:hypothetical protein
MVNDNTEFIQEARALAQAGEIPTKVSNKLLWALGVDALRERTGMKKDISELKKQAGFWGAVAGLLSGVAVLLVAIATQLF